MSAPYDAQRDAYESWLLALKVLAEQAKKRGGK